MAAKHAASKRTAQRLANFARTSTTPEELADYQILAYNRLAEAATYPTKTPAGLRGDAVSLGAAPPPRGRPPLIGGFPSQNEFRNLPCEVDEALYGCMVGVGKTDAPMGISVKQRYWPAAAIQQTGSIPTWCAPYIVNFRGLSAKFCNFGQAPNTERR